MLPWVVLAQIIEPFSCFLFLFTYLTFFVNHGLTSPTTATTSAKLEQRQATTALAKKRARQ
jgi:hypothetical protein